MKNACQVEVSHARHAHILRFTMFAVTMPPRCAMRSFGTTANVLFNPYTVLGIQSPPISLCYLDISCVRHLVDGIVLLFGHRCPVPLRFPCNLHLGLQSTASAADIKSQYHKLAMKFHPDRTGGDDRKFKDVNKYGTSCFTSNLDCAYSYGRLRVRMGPRCVFRYGSGDNTKTSHTWEDELCARMNFKRGGQIVVALLAYQTIGALWTVVRISLTMSLEN